MVRLEIKNSSELTNKEIASLNKICKAIYSENPDNHITDNHINKTNPVFYLWKKDDSILAFQAYTLFYEKTPFSKKSLPIVYINLAYKNPSADLEVKNFAKKSNLIFLKNHLGKFWFLKPFVLIFITNNPKIYDRLSKAIYKIYPNVKHITPKNVLDFAKLLTSKKLKFEDARLSDNLIIEQDCYEKCEITKAWSSFYESNNPAVNDLFIKNKAVIKRDDKYFLAEKAIFFIGHYNFWKKLLKRKSS